MIILLEGPDGAGKSVLYKQLQNEFSSNFIRSINRNDKGQYLWYKQHIESPYVYFIDRGFISELVYRPIKDDREPNITLEEAGNLCSRHLFVIYCTNKHAYDNMKLRGDDYIKNKNEHKQICTRYEEVITTIDNFTNARVFYYDYSSPVMYNILLDAIRRFIEQTKKEVVHGVR